MAFRAVAVLRVQIMLRAGRLKSADVVSLTVAFQTELRNITPL
jgi:hypothetical protein